MNQKQICGKTGEIKATEYLKKSGYEIICNNFRCMQGEIDIVAKDKNEVVFIEVKTRNNRRYGEGRDAVNKNKQKHIIDATRYYLYKNNMESTFVRIDVIEVYVNKGDFIINHIKKII